MLDNYGNILLKPSPLKMGFWKKVGGFLFGDNSEKKDGKKKLAAHEAALDKMSADLKNIDTSNPYENATNAMAGLDNKMSGLDNVYDKAENVYEGKMKNAFEGQGNAYDGMKNEMEGMENSFEDLTVNTQQAEFEAQQNQQMQANIMSQMSGAAGGSGIAALAQSMANQGALQASKASASIGAQEAENNKKAAEAGQDISMKTADEASKIAMTQAGEQSRLDTQANQADMDIQNKILGADEALQSQKLGEASKLQMAEATEASKLQMAEAQGADYVFKATEVREGEALDRAQTQVENAQGVVAGHQANKNAAIGSAIGQIGGVASAIGGAFPGKVASKTGFTDAVNAGNQFNVDTLIKKKYVFGED